MPVLLLSSRKGLAVAFMRADQPLDVASLAATLCRGAQVEAAIARVPALLARLRQAHSESGKTFAPRRTA